MYWHQQKPQDTQGKAFFSCAHLRLNLTWINLSNTCLTRVISSGGFCRIHHKWRDYLCVIRVTRSVKPCKIKRLQLIACLRSYRLQANRVRVKASRLPAWRLLLMFHQAMGTLRTVHTNRGRNGAIGAQWQALYQLSTSVKSEYSSSVYLPQALTRDSASLCIFPLFSW